MGALSTQTPRKSILFLQIPLFCLTMLLRIEAQNQPEFLSRSEARSPNVGFTTIRLRTCQSVPYIISNIYLSSYCKVIENSPHFLHHQTRIQTQIKTQEAETQTTVENHIFKVTLLIVSPWLQLSVRFEDVQVRQNWNKLPWSD
jgi:hypothetical protein